MKVFSLLQTLIKASDNEDLETCEGKYNIIPENFDKDE